MRSGTEAGAGMTAAVSRPTQPVPEPAIHVQDLSISYRIRLDNDSMWADLRDVFRRGTSRERVVPALRDVSFEVQQGSVTCVIGRNGAGKTTLLRAISGVLAPESGRIVVRGQMNLLAPGVGFNPSMSGRENIRLGGLAAGMAAERIDQLTDEIADFAELDEYIDYPIKTYSSGMKARLAFSVAAHLDPELLLIDEALSAGDAAFANKVGEKMADLCGHGRTIILVTHNLKSVRESATDAVWLHQGRVVSSGDPDDVVAQYMRYCRLEHLDLLENEGG
jgi:ABC-type polysaccharide/polyol phosphate transport system ATPase subunit